MGNVDIDGALRYDYPFRPGSTKQLFAGENTVGILQEEFEHFVFGFGKQDVLPVNRHPLGVGIDLDAAKADTVSGGAESGFYDIHHVVARLLAFVY